MDGLVAGVVAGSATTLAMHPLDIAKVRLQVGRAKSLHEALGELVRGGPAVAYRGLIPNLVGNATAWGSYFYIYETLRRSAAPHLGESGHTARSLWACSFTAGLLTQAATNPVWVIKTQVLASRKADPGAPSGAVDALRRVINANGIRGLWRGFVPGTLGTLQSSIYFAIYDSLKPKISERWKRHWPKYASSADVASWFCVSAFAKVIAATALYPHQVLRAYMQNGPQAFTIREVVAKVWAEQGVTGFYRGLSANLIRVVPAMTVTLVVYELTKRSITGAVV